MSKDKYKVTNWKQYNEGLKQRGSIRVWISEDVLEQYYTTICRRSGSLGVDLCTRIADGVTNILVDSTGLKVYGKGEWKVRKHGAGKRRKRMKLHTAVEAGQSANRSGNAY